MRRALFVLLPMGLTLWVTGCEPSVNPDLRRQEFANLKQIGFAVHQYDNNHQRFPAAAIRDESGKPLLSWRVALLPCLGEGELYNQFRVDEPWDSDHNIKLVRQMPNVYLVPGRENEGKTSIMMFTGEGTPFGGPEGPKGSDMPDGISQTIMCVVTGADKAVRWTKPEDLRFHANNPLATMGEIPGRPSQGGFQVGQVATDRIL